MDVSGLGLGAKLYQELKEKSIVYSSRGLNVHEKNYGISELEVLAVFWAVKKTRHNIQDRHFKIVTNHHSLCSLKTMRDPKGKLGSWTLDMAENQHDIMHKSLILHMDADRLSWYPLQVEHEDPEQQVYTTVAINVIDQWDNGHYRVEQVKDHHTSWILAKIRDLKCSCDNGMQLHHEWTAVFPAPQWLLETTIGVGGAKSSVGADYESGTGLRSAVTWASWIHWPVWERVYWSGVVEDIKQYCKTCGSCQKMNSPSGKQAGLLQPIVPAGVPVSLGSRLHWNPANREWRN